MGCCVDVWRCAIGNFYNKLRPVSTSCRFLFSINFFVAFTKLKHKLMAYCISILLFFQSVVNQNIELILLLSILRAGDVHPNPGPAPSNTLSADDQVSIDTCQSDCGLNIMNLNIRSVRNKLQFLEHFTEDVDILCLTETHLDEAVSNSELLLENFTTMFRKDRNSYGGGVLIYAKHDVVLKRREDLEPANDETIWVELIIENTKYILGFIYRPPLQNVSSGIWDRLRHSLDMAFAASPNVILTGDLNVDLLSNSTHHLSDIFYHYNL